MKSSQFLSSIVTLTALFLATSVSYGQDAEPSIPPEPTLAPAPVTQPSVQEQYPSATLGRAGQLALSAERLFGVAWESEGTDESGTETTRSTTTVTLLSSRISGVIGNYSFSRVAADYFVSDGLSVGAALGYFNASGHYERTSAGVTDESDTGSASGFVVAPRIGYAVMLTPTIGIWPKAGITYTSLSLEDADGNDAGSRRRIAFSLDAPLVITPVPHAGLMIGPTLDYGVSGSDEEESTDTSGATTTNSIDVSTKAIGLHAGLFVYF
jgi:hypothetical protein